MAKKNVKKKAAKKTSEPKRGRPPGSPNVDIAAQQPLAKCRHCQSTKLKVIKKLITQEYAGEINGVRYTSIERRRAKCESCGCIQILISRPYDPKKWAKKL